MPLTRNKPRTYSAAEPGAQPLADGTVVYEGACMGVHAATGRVRALVSGDLFAGFARQKVDSTILLGGQAAASVPLAAGGTVELAVSGATATSLGASVYATDDDTFSLASGSLVGTVVRVPSTGLVECRFSALVPSVAASQVAALRAIADSYDQQPSVWHAGELNSVVTPGITADGDLTSATDQIPLKWLAVINADDDVTAAQALMDGGPNVIEILPGAQIQKRVLAADGVTPEVITRIYVVCISSSAVPADYTGGAYILSDLESDIADALANMARLDFSSGLGATVARLVASAVYNTHYTQLSVAAGVVA